MSACSQCGTVAKPTDRFCNVCGTPLAQPGPAPGPAPAPAQPPYAAPPQAYGSPPAALAGGYVARCQAGHEMAPGASYCAQGHPIALDQMQFAGGAHGGAGGAGYGQAAGPQYAPTQSPGGVYGAAAAPGAFGAPAAGQPPPGYAQPQPQYAPVPAPGLGSPGPYPGAPPMATPPPPAYPEKSRDAAPVRVLRGFVVAYGTNAAGDFWPLTGGRHIVGRLGSGDGVDVALQDPTISSRHAAFVVDGNAGTITVEDTGSTNGTFVNDEHIGFNGRRDLRDGDRVRFGGFTTIVKVVGRV